MYFCGVNKQIMLPEEFKTINFHSDMKLELNNGEVYPILAVDFNNELITFRANDGCSIHATINYVRMVIDP